MAQRKKYTPEQIVSLLRQVEVAVASGKTTSQASREASITEQATDGLLLTDHIADDKLVPAGYPLRHVFASPPNLSHVPARKSGPRR